MLRDAEQVAKERNLKVARVRQKLLRLDDLTAIIRSIDTVVTSGRSIISDEQMEHDLAAALQERTLESHK